MNTYAFEDSGLQVAEDQGGRGSSEKMTVGPPDGKIAQYKSAMPNYNEAAGVFAQKPGHAQTPYPPAYPEPLTTHEEYHGPSEPAAAQAPRRILGLRARTLLLILAIVLLLIVAIVLGAVLGTQLNKPSVQAASASPAGSSASPAATNEAQTQTQTSTRTPSRSQSQSQTSISPPLTTATIPLPNGVTLFSDCPSSNGTVHAVQRNGLDMQFRKLCGSSLFNPSDPDAPLRRAAASLDECIGLCAETNDNGGHVCDSVCWKNSRATDADGGAGMCYGYVGTRRPDHSPVGELTGSTNCDAAYWINP